MNLESGNEACLVCPHVSMTPECVGFVCHLPNGWSAACSEECLDQTETAQLGMVHLKHVLAAQEGSERLASMPFCFAGRKSLSEWKIEYFPVQHEPREGEILAPPLGHQFLSISPNDGVYFFVRKRGIFSRRWTVVWIRLDEGTVCVPFWKSEKNALLFKKYLGGKEKLTKANMAKLRDLATNEGIEYLVPEFLTSSFDYAILAQS